MTQFTHDKYPMSMKLPEGALEEFKAIYLKEYGVELLDGEAYTKASNFLRLIYTVLTAEQKINA